jgi:hypothetical protein
LPRREESKQRRRQAEVLAATKIKIQAFIDDVRANAYKNTGQRVAERMAAIDAKVSDYLADESRKLTMIKDATSRQLDILTRRVSDLELQRMLHLNMIAEKDDELGTLRELLTEHGVNTSCNVALGP